MTGGTVPDWIGSLRVLLRCDVALLLVHANLKDMSQVQRIGDWFGFANRIVFATQPMNRLFRP
jgi:hypothetical protein